MTAIRVMFAFIAGCMWTAAILIVAPADAGDEAARALVLGAVGTAFLLGATLNKRG